MHTQYVGRPTFPGHAACATKEEPSKFPRPGKSQNEEVRCNISHAQSNWSDPPKSHRAGGITFPDEIKTAEHKKARGCSGASFMDEP